MERNRRREEFFDKKIVDAGICKWQLYANSVGKLLRACGGCLGADTRRRARLAAKSPDEPLSGL